MKGGKNKMTNKFKVGDEVAVSKKNIHGSNYYIAGTKGTIIKLVSDVSAKYKLKFENDETGWVDSVELISKNKPKEPTHLVVWEEDTDPCEFFTSEKEAKNFIKVLSEKSNVIEESIVLVEIKSCKKVTIRKSLSYKQHKI